ncbi:MAG: XRE family transcriptional regulator [Myxococcota bacterium]|nr:XRE family transcriptional regulator [Myxococcota bacterium]
MTANELPSFEDALAGDAPDDVLWRAAARSDRLFVRGLDQIAEDGEEARGRKMTAIEALDAYGRQKLREVLAEGAALLCESPSSAGRVLFGRRDLLGLQIRHVASRAGVEPRVVEQAEQSKRLPIREYERIAQALGLDERYISFRSEPVGNERLAYRLRTVGDDLPRMTPSAVSAIAEAVWVATTQTRLESGLGMVVPQWEIQTSSNYGAPGYPAYMQGYYLAHDARKKLALGDGPLTRPLREICEDVLGIPLIQADMGEAIAGVTVQVGDRRAVVLNLSGRNRHVYVRRCTVAHEIGHILYDDDAYLNQLRVDEYDELESPPERLNDPVEQRANAFSVEFIAPKRAMVESFHRETDDPVGAAMDAYGISFTAARYQIWNGLDRSVSWDSLATRRREPDQRFEAGERFTVDFHPVRGIPASRAGRFSAVVLRAAEEGRVSWQTAAEYLRCSAEDLKAAADDTRALFPAVFRT